LHISERAFSGREDVVNVALPDGFTHIYQSACKGCVNLKSIALPDSLLGIGHGAFKECISLTDIAIPNGVDRLELFTFHGCGALRSVALPDSEITILCHAFNFCVGLEDITIPAKAQKIYPDAFTGCSSMRNIFVDPENAAYSDLDGVLYDKDRTMLVRYPEGKHLKELIVPDGVTEIGEDAFSGCGRLEAIRIPAGLAKISDRAFETWSTMGKGPAYVQPYDGVARITVDERNVVYADMDGVLFNKEKTVLLKYPAGRTQAAYAVPDGVAEIARGAFEGCAAIRSVTLPKSVTKIGWRAFYMCVQLGSVSVSADAIDCEWGAFDKTAWYTSQPDGLVYVGKTVYGYKGEMPENTRIQIAEGTTGIAERAFINQTKLVGVTMPDSVVRIGPSAFNGCHKLSDVEMPSANVNIGDCAFDGTCYERKEQESLGMKS
jgi:hypothetical protein